MITKQIIPEDRSSLLIDKFLKIELTETTGRVKDKFIPDGYCGAVIHFGEPADMFDGEKYIPLPAFFITKPFLGHMDIRVPVGNDSFIAILKTSVFTRLFNISLEPFQKMSHFEMSRSKFSELLNGLGPLAAFEERAAYFSNYVSEKIIPEDFSYDDIDKIYFKIIGEGGVSPIKSILPEFDINPRTFRRNFIKRVGVSAKTLSRIVRVNYFCKQIENISEQDFHNFIYQCNYCDQAHFINDFKAITGETPKNFFSRDLSIVKAVSGF